MTLAREQPTRMFSIVRDAESGPRAHKHVEIRSATESESESKSNASSRRKRKINSGSDHLGIAIVSIVASISDGGSSVTTKQTSVSAVSLTQIQRKPTSVSNHTTSVSNPSQRNPTSVSSGATNHRRETTFVSAISLTSDKGSSCRQNITITKSGLVFLQDTLEFMLLTWLRICQRHLIECARTRMTITVAQSCMNLVIQGVVQMQLQQHVKKVTQTPVTAVPRAVIHDYMATILKPPFQISKKVSVYIALSLDFIIRCVIEAAVREAVIGSLPLHVEGIRIDRDHLVSTLESRTDFAFYHAHSFHLNVAPRSYKRQKRIRSRSRKHKVSESVAKTTLYSNEGSSAISDPASAKPLTQKTGVSMSASAIIATTATTATTALAAQ